jgi:hypothetical protein
MAQHTPVEDQVIDMLHRAHICDLEEVTRTCTKLTWNQVFLAVDRLSRSGEIMFVPRAGAFIHWPSRTGRKVGLIDAHFHLNHKEVILCLR